MSDYQICLEEDPPKEDIDAVGEILGQYNREHASEPDDRPLIILLRDKQGRVLGGLKGLTRWGYLCVNWLAIQAEARHGGYGSRLLAAAEHEAVARGCRYARLDTFSFQALPFYQKLGYDVVGVIEDFPPGHQQYYLRKILVDSSD